MRPREMHPLCCISVDCSAGAGARSPAEAEAGWRPPAAAEGRGGQVVAVAGVLYKWTNIGKGWRTRWFSLRDGVLSYSKIRRREAAPLLAAGEVDGVRLIGTASARLSAGEGGDAGEGRRPPQPPPKPIGVVHLKISSIRESKSDDRRFYIISPKKTLRLRTDSKTDRLAWVEALVSARSGFSLDGRISTIPNHVSFSTERLRDRMHVEGLSEALIRDCEEIMQSEFSDFRRQLRLHFEERLSVGGTFQPQLEENNATGATRTIHKDQLQLMNHECSCSGHGKYSEYSTTESSDEVERRELDELSDDEEPYFFDSKEKFGDSIVISDFEITGTDPAEKGYRVENQSRTTEMMDIGSEEHNDHTTVMHIERRKKLPDPIEKEKSVSLWSMIKDNVGKDLTRVCLPVYFNEPLSSLQKCFEDLEYSHLLDRAYEYGKKGNSLMRILNVAAFAVSGYASSEGRLCKPFNPLLGETYEADYPEKGIRFFSEKVSHHPMLIACHCEGKGWKFWGDSNLRSKFWGQTIQLDPVGVLTLEFDDGEIFQWSKVTTSIYNLILGKVHCNHHGTMNIWGNQQYSCKLKFKEQSILDRNPRQVQGFVEDASGYKVATLMGKWDDSMYYNICGDFSKTTGSKSTESATLLWRRNKPLPNSTRYNFSSFAITLNELTPELQEKLPPTDSRLRPDQRYLENGEYENANAEKLRLEKRQRMSTKLQENGWKPRWFHRDSEDGTFRYIGGYWEAREQKNWDGCLDIFGEFSDDLNVTPFK